MKDSNDVLFGIEIDFEKGTESPSRVFKAMSELIETFEGLDRELVQSIDPHIEIVAMIEDIEIGSLRAWLKNKLEAINEEDLRNFEWRKIVGSYLADANRIIIDFLGGKTKISNKEEIQELEDRLLKSAEETQVRHIPVYTPVNRQKILSGIKKMGDAMSHLKETDKAIYLTEKDEIIINKEFEYIPDDIEQLLTKQSIKTESRMILKVKKPDYLGTSKWDLRHESRIIDAKVLDYEWLKKFQSREIDVRPGDSLNAMVDIVVKYGYDDEVVNINYIITKVLDILPSPSNKQLPLPGDKNETEKED